MVEVEEGIVEVKRRNIVRHVGVVSGAGVPVAQHYVVQPVRHHAGCVHQVPEVETFRFGRFKLNLIFFEPS